MGDTHGADEKVAPAVLMDRSLVLGPIDQPSMHDIVLDFAVAQTSPAELRSKHRRLVNLIRDRRPVHERSPTAAATSKFAKTPTADEDLADQRAKASARNRWGKISKSVQKEDKWAFLRVGPKGLQVSRVIS
jgi:hypothetical protein